MSKRYALFIFINICIFTKKLRFDISNQDFLIKTNKRGASNEQKAPIKYKKYFFILFISTFYSTYFFNICNLNTKFTLNTKRPPFKRWSSLFKCIT